MENGGRAVATLRAPDIFRRVVRLQILTVGWMTVEAAVALAAAWAARSPALLGFGRASAAELLSATAGRWRCRSTTNPVSSDEMLAALVAGALLFVVTGLLDLGSGLSLVGYREPKPSFS